MAVKIEMDMPKNCNECPFYNWQDEICNYNNRTVNPFYTTFCVNDNTKKGRDRSCPLKEVK